MSVPVSDRVQLARRMLYLAFNSMGSRTSLEAISDRLYGMRDSEFTPVVAEQIEQEVAEIQERVRANAEQGRVEWERRKRALGDARTVRAYRDFAARKAELADHLENAYHNVRGMEFQISKNTDAAMAVHLERRLSFEIQRVQQIHEAFRCQKISSI